jgi:hypothetical protein
MKKTILLFVFAAGFFACNQTPVTLEVEEQHQHQELALSLNNGSKWQADTETNENVAYLKLLTDGFSKMEKPTVEDYHSLAGDLTAGINKMIRECKMTGPDHEELHQWLEPVIKNSNDLKSASDGVEARKEFIYLNDQLNSYNKYFE